RIFDQIDSFQAKKKAVSTEPTQNEAVVYEIYDLADRGKSTDLEKLAELDRRIEQMEALLGRPDPARLSALTADTAHHGLVEAASRLAARSALLQPTHLDHVEARLFGLHTRLQSLTEKREAIADADTQNKIAELYELVKKWNNVYESLPTIVDRLSIMKDLHEQAADFSRGLALMELGQKGMEEKLRNYSGLLEQVRESMGENMEIIKNNLISLEAKTQP
ncbi:unnamed protein product, partial [Protopolystoma xenopodis]